MSTSTPVIEIINGRKTFNDFVALTDINLSVAQGEIFTLLGPSGCGKTTLMRMIAGFDSLTSGELKIDGVEATGKHPEHRPVNMVFQRYALFPHLDVFDNVAFGLKVKGASKSEIKQRVQEMLHIVQLDSFSHRYIDELSGGQSQRVALARALVNRPKVLLLDEPLAALDLKIRQHMLAEMKRIHSETKATFIYVTHDQDEAMVLSDHVVLMERGRIVQIDRPEDMYAKPKSLFAAKFLGETNLFHATVKKCTARETVAVSDTGVLLRSDGRTAYAEGEKVVVSIRPESMGFGSSTREAGQSVTGVVEDITFIGSRSFYKVALEGGQSIRVQVQRNAKAHLPSNGERTVVSWDATDVVMLPA